MKVMGNFNEANKLEIKEEAESIFTFPFVLYVHFVSVQMDCSFHRELDGGRDERKGHRQESYKTSSIFSIHLPETRHRSK